MEVSLAYSGSPSSSICLNHGVLRTHLPISTMEKSFSPSSSSSSSNSIGSHGRRRAVPVIRALKTTPSSRGTLSSNWDVSQDCFSATSAPSWLPRLEELDTTNMLLRQRIIFLGSQVISLNKGVFYFYCFYYFLHYYFKDFVTVFIHLFSKLNSEKFNLSSLSFSLFDLHSGLFIYFFSSYQLFESFSGI